MKNWSAIRRRSEIDSRDENKNTRIAAKLVATCPTAPPLSRARTLVVPTTAIMRLRRLRVRTYLLAKLAIDLDVLGVHGMFENIRDAHRQKRTGADMQRYEPLHPRRARGNAVNSRR